MVLPAWKSARYGVRLDRYIPEQPGVYVLSEVRRLHGLLVEVDHRYVGQSINLRRRWQQHLGPLEPNPALERLAGSADVEFWFRRAGREELDRLEAELIEELNPPGNRRRGRRQRS